ncbi:MAG TPA: uracil-DNA glycosylase [Patescibacteria group bacterium]|nr:uracil-DNA glycosylase [Patescibacteria group bacterium]
MKQYKNPKLRSLYESLLTMQESPLYAHRKEHNYLPVLGEGNENANIMFIGEAPGQKEAETGRPFVGAAGKMLDELLAGIGLKREDVFISNIINDRPPQNRDPQPAEIALYSPVLAQLIRIIKPNVVATLGRFSMQYMLEKCKLPESGQTITTLHGNILPVTVSYGTLHLIPLYHPAVALYNSNMKKVLQKDFEVLKQFS